jgi:hypothetical protein
MLATRGPRRRKGRRKRPSSFTPAIMKIYSVRARAIAAAGYNDLDNSRHIGLRENDAYNAGWKDVRGRSSGRWNLKSPAMRGY